MFTYLFTFVGILITSICMNRNLAILHIGIFLLSFPALFAKGIDIPAGVLSWWRCLFGAVVAFSVLFMTSKSKVAKDKLKWLAITGCLMGLHWWTYFTSVQYSTVAIGILALFTYPIIVVILEPLFFKTKYSIKQVVGGAGIILGVYFLVPEFSLENKITIGVIIGVLSAVFFAIRNILTRKYLNSVPAFTTMSYHVAFAFLVLSISLFSGIEKFQIPTINEAGLILILGTAFTLGSHGLIVYSLKNFSAATVSILGSLQVLYGAILAFFIFAELPNMNFYIGAVIILGIATYEMLPLKK